jgi:hypothetical protein
MAWTTTDKVLFYGLRWCGLAIMLLALVLSFTLNVRSDLRYGIVGIMGIVGYGLSTAAKTFKQPIDRPGS